MYSLRHLRSQVDALQRRLKPVLAILRLRNLAMEFCDELEEAAFQEDPYQRNTLLEMSRMFMPRVGRAGFRLETYTDLMGNLVSCIDSRALPQPREIVLTLLPWARKGPHLRPDLWERPTAAQRKIPSPSGRG